MKILVSGDVEKNFWAVAEQVRAGEVVRVTHDGLKSFVMLPDTEETDALLRARASEQLLSLLRAVPINRDAQVLTQQDINQLIRDSFA